MNEELNNTHVLAFFITKYYTEFKTLPFLVTEASDVEGEDIMTFDIDEKFLALCLEQMTQEEFEETFSNFINDSLEDMLNSSKEEWEEILGSNNG